jgi:hypothetical protein
MQGNLISLAGARNSMRKRGEREQQRSERLNDDDFVKFTLCFFLCDETEKFCAGFFLEFLS